MVFSTDKQTLEDLKIFDKYGRDSVFQLFNRCATRGGATVLEDMFSHPLSGAEVINRRSGIIRYFAERGVEFPVKSSASFEAIDPYLSNTDDRTRLSAKVQSLGRKLSTMVAADTETLVIHKGITALVALLNHLNAFIALPAVMEAELYSQDRNNINELLNATALKQALEGNGSLKLTHAKMAELDIIFRFKYRNELQKLLQSIYTLDVYISVGRVATQMGFVFPVALPGKGNEVELKGVYHPAVPNAVPNDIHITPDNNVIFLTGANMAGKSTFMKSLSIALFLAHVGFPVAAKSMKFQVLDGIFTTINLPDNLGMGASHFYAEVLRLKKVAHELSQGKRLFVVFDELFRGTNVKDAYEATIEVTSAFVEKKDSIFVISTHIIEAGDILRQHCSNIDYLYLPTQMNGTHPVYTYKLERGITNDRHGMIIINNEKILELLEEGFLLQKNKKRSDNLTVVKS